MVCDWRIISADDPFFQVTKAIHNGSQGADRTLPQRERAVYLANTQRNAALLEEQYDFVVVHDPQPAGILPAHGKGQARWVWRCHIDTSQPNPEVWAFLRRQLEGYDAAVFTMAEFVPPALPIGPVEIIPPALDPLSVRPVEGPAGGVAAYRLVRQEIPNLQLALVGSMALDDPQGWEVYRQIRAASQADPMIHVFTNLTGVGNVEVNAFQRLSNVMVQTSIRESFGLAGMGADAGRRADAHQSQRGDPALFLWRLRRLLPPVQHHHLQPDGAVMSWRLASDATRSAASPPPAQRRHSRAASSAYEAGGTAARKRQPTHTRSLAWPRTGRSTARQRARDAPRPGQGRLIDRAG